jgi:hypothetical protein
MKITRRWAVGATVGLMVLVPATTALADSATATATATTPAPGSSSTPAGSSQSGQAWAKAHAKLMSALQARVSTLGRLNTSVGDSKDLTSADRSALNGLLGPETSGINALLATVQAATPQNTTVAQLRADAKTMVDQYRVYLVMSRQVHLTERADTQTTVELRISNREPKIQAAIQKAGNPPAAVQAYHDLVTQVTNATQATGQADIPAVLQVTPSGYPGDAAPLSAASTALHQAATDGKAAAGDLKIIRNALTQHDSSLKGQSTPTASA